MGADKNLLQSEARLKISSAHPTLESQVKCGVTMEELDQHETALGTSEKQRGSKQREVAAEDTHGIHTD